MIKHMAENINPNQNPQPVQSSGQNPPSVPVNQPPNQPPASAPSPSAPPPSGQEPDLNELFKLFGSRKGLLIGLLIAVLLIGILAFYAKNLKKPAKDVPSKEQEQLVPASLIPNSSPPAPPPIKDESKIKILKDYFSKASPQNFHDGLLQGIPEQAIDLYLKYSSATASAELKLGAARNFWIMINNPAVNRADPKFQPFMKDVRAALEKELGKPLF